MILKILIVGFGLYMLYRMIMPNAQLSGRKEDQKISDQQDDDGEYVDYEEVD